jgi:hypothetical protein
MTNLDTPAQWLIMEYEFIGEYEAADPGGSSVPVIGPWGSVHVQPIFTLKSGMDSGYPMRVTAADYHNPNRRWL